MTDARCVAALLAALLGAGCAMRVDPMPIEPHLAPERGHGSGPRLAVAPFEDLRDAAQRRGERPPLRLRWSGLVRQGPNRTGDAAFAGEVAEGARRDAIATLQRSRLFADVQPVGRTGPVDGDLLLSARIEVLEGIQDQRQELSPIHVGGLRSRFGPAQGTAVIHYAVEGPDGRIWEQRIETVAAPPDATITRAMLDALALSSEALVAALQDSVVRVVPRLYLPVRVVDLCGLAPERVSAAFDAAALALTREVGLGLRATHERAPSHGTPRDAGEGLTAARAFAPPEGGLVVLLAPLEPPRGGAGERRRGLAEPFGRHAVVACDEGGRIGVSTLLHEIGHLLGAIHVDERSSIMHASAEFDARFLDAINRRILRALGPAPLARPLPESVRRELRALYRAARQFPEEVAPDDVEAALRALPR